ncbi:hypothetical protein GOODEAATRI_022891, partial [Goodea atripinnis]
PLERGNSCRDSTDLPTGLLILGWLGVCCGGHSVLCSLFGIYEHGFWTKTGSAQGGLWWGPDFTPVLDSTTCTVKSWNTVCLASSLSHTPEHIQAKLLSTPRHIHLQGSQNGVIRGDKDSKSIKLTKAWALACPN